MTMIGRTSAFADHFSSVAAQYAEARPEYPAELFRWIAEISPATERVWEAGCGSGQASRGLADVFANVFATDPSEAQITQASGPSHVHFAVEPAERCSLPDHSVDAVCVAQALHWFDRPRFFEECARVLKPQGVLVAWGYQDVAVPEVIAGPVAAFAHTIRAYWPEERAFVDRAYADFEFPFEPCAAFRPEYSEIRATWPLARMLGYFSSYSATKRYREMHVQDPVAMHAEAIATAWGDPMQPKEMRWPLFVCARRKG